MLQGWIRQCYRYLDRSHEAVFQRRLDRKAKMQCAHQQLVWWRKIAGENLCGGRPELYGGEKKNISGICRESCRYFVATFWRVSTRAPSDDALRELKTTSRWNHRQVLR